MTAMDCENTTSTYKLTKYKKNGSKRDQLLASSSMQDGTKYASGAEKRDLMSQPEVKMTNMAQVEDHNHRARVGREEDRGTL